ncbi:MAG: restriction endonuclease subunit S [Paracoccaceae bacterium]
MTRRYPAYKDSGVEWLGEVPQGWEVRPIKGAFDVVGGTTPKSDVPEYWDGDINWVTPADLSNLPSRFIHESGRQITEAGLGSCGTTVVPLGSIVLSVRAPIGSLAIAAREVCTNQGCKALVPTKRAQSDFFYFVLEAAREALNILGRGSTFLELSGDQLAAFRVPLPPLPEQTAIAAFLDRETAKIDALVAEQRRLIDLLREKRQAVISHAVTKGLNPNAPLKPSGIDWLGNVPEGWEVVKLSAYFKASKGPRGQTLTKEYCGQCPGEYPVYSGQTDSLGVMGSIDDFDFDAGDEGVLFSTTVGAKAMTVSHILGKFSLSQNCMIISPISDAIRPRFYFHHFQPLFSYCRSQIPDHMQPSFRMSDLYQFKIALPPKADQDEIASNLDALSAEFDQLIGVAYSAISLMQERRAALISAAVTGKIDVRHLAPHSTETSFEEVA